MPVRRRVALARVMGLVRERRRFLRSFLATPSRVGAVLPTSAHTVRATLDLAPVVEARCVVELGAGTGPYTREILRRLPSDGRLMSFEVDPMLAGGAPRAPVCPPPPP